MIRVKLITYANYKYVEDWYNMMYSRGWEISKLVLNMFHIFKKSNSKNKTFRFFPVDKERGSSAFSKEELENYYEMCRNYGWEIVCNSKNLDLFYTENLEVAKPLFNDLVDEKSLIKRIFSRKFNQYIVVFLLVSYNLIFNLMTNFTVKGFLYDNSVLINILCKIFLFLGVLPVLIELMTFSFSNRKNWDDPNKALKFYDFTPPLISIFLLLGILFFILYGVFLVLDGAGSRSLVLLIPLAISLAIGLYVRKKVIVNNYIRKSRRQGFVLLAIVLIIAAFSSVFNFLVTSYSKEGNIKVPYPALRSESSKSAFFEKRSSIFVPLHYYYNDNEFYTHYSRSINKWVLEELIEEGLKESKEAYKKFSGEEFNIVEVDGSRWKADRAFILPHNSLMLVKNLDIWYLRGEEGINITDSKYDEKIIKEIIEKEKSPN